jgi:UDP-glucose 4-epimerase
LIGRALIAELAREGWRIDALGRQPSRLRLPGLTWRRADLLDPDSLTTAAKASHGASVLFHLAAVMPDHRPSPGDDAYIAGNVLACSRLFAAAADIGVRTIVYSSGVSVIGNPGHEAVTETRSPHPRSMYTLSKLAGELLAGYYAEGRGVATVSLRITSPYGPGMRPSSVLPRFAAAAVAGKRLEWFGSGARTQNFVHARDVARALVLAATRSAAGVYNIAGPQTISMKDLAKLVVDLAPEAGSTAGPAAKTDPQEHERWEVDTARASRDLGYIPTIALRDGLREYLEYLRHVSRANPT